MNITRTRHFGERGREYERISLAFQICGFTPPSMKDGDYAINIVNAYQSDLSEEEALDIIVWALSRSLAFLQSELALPEGDRITLEEIRGYGSDTYWSDTELLQP